MDLIWRLAANEMAAGRFREIEPDHVCLALLKFADVSVKPPDGAAGQAELANAVAGEAQLVREALDRCSIESTGVRRKLRGHLGKGDSPYKGGKVQPSAASRALLEAAARLAAESGGDLITPLHVLTALVQSPTPAMAQVLLGQIPPPPVPAPLPPLPYLDQHGRDLGRQAAEGQLALGPGLDAQAKAVLQAVQQKDRRSILLVSESRRHVEQLAAALAKAMVSNDAPAGLKGRRLIDVSMVWRARQRLRLPAEAEAADLTRMRQLLAEAAAHPEVILLVPSVEAAPGEGSGGSWPRLLEETLSKGAAQVISQVRPSVFTEHLRQRPVWRRQARAVWVDQEIQGSVPREL